MKDESDWPPPDCPPVAWPVLQTDADRLVWYQKVARAYAQLWSKPVPQPRVGEEQIQALEKRLGCLLPQALRQYHLHVGELELAERLCAISGTEGDDYSIQRLIAAYPGFFEITTDPKDIALAEHLVAFGDYLGNGNMFCFHDQTGEVYWFDHDDGQVLTRFFASPEHYLDALMLLSLAEIHDRDEEAEDLLVQRFSHALVRKWRY